jgi:prepilin-type N-terminal cleavage/methylation domain-containing protein
MTTNYKTNQCGFTIIESLVAISIMLVAIAGPLTLANNSISNAVASKQQLEASYLGQDLLEYIRWVRDTEGTSQFLGEVGSLCTVSDPCAVDTTKTTFTGPTGSDSALKGSCSDPSVCVLYYDKTGTHQYGHDGTTGATPTTFSRSLAITRISSDEFTATVVTAWKTPSGVRAVTLKEDFMNWK